MTFCPARLFTAWNKERIELLFFSVEQHKPDQVVQGCPLCSRAVPSTADLDRLSPFPLIPRVFSSERGSQNLHRVVSTQEGDITTGCEARTKV